MEKIHMFAYRKVSVFAMLSFLFFGFTGLVAMDQSNDGANEPDITAYLKQDYVKRDHEVSRLPYQKKEAYDSLLYFVNDKIEDMMCAPSDFDIIHPENSKSVDVYLNAWMPNNIKATVRVAPREGVNRDVFSKVPKKFKECGIDCELEFIKYEDR